MKNTEGTLLPSVAGMYYKKNTVQLILQAAPSIGYTQKKDIIDIA
jgi:hypothetical protein